MSDFQQMHKQTLKDVVFLCELVREKPEAADHAILMAAEHGLTLNPCGDGMFLVSAPGLPQLPKMNFGAAVMMLDTFLDLRNEIEEVARQIATARKQKLVSAEMAGQVIARAKKGGAA